MRAADDGQSLLQLKARLGAVGRARGGRAGDERARLPGERVVNRDEHDGARARRARRGAQARGLRAQLVDRRRREHEVVRVGERVRVAPARLQAVGEARAAAELAQVVRASELKEERAVVTFRVVVVEPRRERRGAQGRRDAFDEGREFRGRVRRRGLGLPAAAR